MTCDHRFHDRPTPSEGMGDSFEFGRAVSFSLLPDHRRIKLKMVFAALCAQRSKARLLPDPIKQFSSFLLREPSRRIADIVNVRDHLDRNEL